MGAGSAAVAAAQAQAVSNTSLQLQPQNRRTSSGTSLKSGYNIALKSPHVSDYLGMSVVILITIIISWHLIDI